MQSSQKLLLLFSLIIASCTTNNQKQKNETRVSSADTTQRIDTLQKQVVTTKTSTDSDTLTVDTKLAVFYQPDSLQTEKRMREVGEENFRIGMDDYLFSMHSSWDYLEKQGLPILDAKSKKYLKFTLSDKSMQLIKLDTLKELWGLYLFDPKKKAYSADMTLIEEDFKNYFK